MGDGAEEVAEGNEECRDGVVSDITSEPETPPSLSPSGPGEGDIRRAERGGALQVQRRGSAGVELLCPGAV